MSTLFIELCLDEDVNVLVAALLRARGFTTLTTREAGRLQSSDAEQLAYAVSQHKTSLTHNRVDFEALAKEYLADRNTHDDILAVRHPAQEIVRRLLRILDQVTADEMRDQVRYI